METEWSRLGPRLDAAMEELAEDDRRAVVMRFFENRRVKEIAAAMQLSEDAAQKRISRALDKLRDVLAARGFATVSAMLATELAAHAVAPAPPGLATTLAGVAKGFTGGSTVGGWLGTAAGTAAVICAVVFAWHQTRDAHAEAARVAALGDQWQSVQARLRSEEAALRHTAAPTESLSSGTLRDAENDPALKRKAAALVQGVSDLRRHLKANPGRMIPEMRLLTDQDWLEVARQFGSPESDDDYRKAFSGLREAAKKHFALLLEPALQAYEKDHAGSLPTETLQLASYFNPPIGADILERYAFESHPAPQSTSDAIMEKPSALVDDNYDSFFAIGTGGFSWRRSDGGTDMPFRVEMDMLNAQRAFKAEHPGRSPVGEALLPYFADPTDAQIYLSSRPSKP